MLSSSEELVHPPTWAEGYLVQSGGILSLTRLRMGGDVRVQADASLNMSRCIFGGQHSLVAEGGHVRIDDFSELTALEGRVEVGNVESFTVLNSTVHMGAAAASSGGPAAGSSIVLLGTEFQSYGSWYEVTLPAGARRFTDLTITLDAARADGSGMAVGTVLGTIGSESDEAVSCARSGWQGWECLQDIDECADEENENAGCHQVCVNTPGSHHCECDSGYKLIAGSETQCEDIDECALQGCATGNLARECRGSPGAVDSNSSSAAAAAGAADQPRCQHFCTNFEGTFQVRDLPFSRQECGKRSCCCAHQHAHLCMRVCACASSYNSYACVRDVQCSCDPGLIIIEGDGYNCRDLNECMDEGVWGDPCIEIAHATCDNLHGAAQCICDAGYVSNTGGETLMVVVDGQIVRSNGTACSENVPEPEP
eukprot:COSAG06_NODE_1002_length_11132_cov_16.903381_1_plen_425_part_00